MNKSGVSIVFVLPSSGGGGGANSVVQEAMGFRRMGIEADIAVNESVGQKFSISYPELQAEQVAVHTYKTPKDLARSIVGYRIACATTNASVDDVVSAWTEAKQPDNVKLTYYVQDYEPLFYPINSDAWKRAYRSYSLIPGGLFAKTNWLCNIVYENHGVKVRKVRPSIDHEIFFPNLGRAAGSEISILAMIRPPTPRRAPVRTWRILESLARRFPGKVKLHAFGSTDQQLKESGIELSFSIINHGSLRRTEVPTLLRDMDLFLDLSDYQAFGRTGLEAMASGCVAVLPKFGGTNEYAVHGSNSFVIDTRSDGQIVSAVDQYLALSESDRTEMRINALDTAADFDTRKACLSELRVFGEILSSS